MSHQASSASRKWRSTLIKPALLTSTSTLLKRASTSSNKRSTCSLLDTSATPGTADPPLLIICWTVASTPAALTSLTITCAPSLPKRRAIARPMPHARHQSPAQLCWKSVVAPLCYPFSLGTPQTISAVTIAVITVSKTSNMFSCKQVRSGAGLGMPSDVDSFHRFLLKHGGRITIFDPDGKGCLQISHLLSHQSNKRIWHAYPLFREERP